MSRTAVVTLEARTGQFRRSMAAARASVSSFRRGVVGIGTAAQGAITSLSRMATIGAGLGAVGAIVAGAKAYGLLADSVRLANTQRLAELNLESVLNNQRKAGVRVVHGLADALKRQAAEIQKKTIIGDEDTIRGQAQLATFRSLIPHIHRATEAMAVFVEFQGVDAVTAANLLGKAAEGNIGALTRYGISLSETARRTKDVELILTEILQQLPEMGISSQTAAGRVDQLANALGDVKEKLGMALSPAIKAVVNEIEPLVVRLDGWVQANQKLIASSVAEFVGDVAVSVAEFGLQVKAFVDSGGLQKIGAGLEFVGAAGRMAFHGTVAVVEGLRAGFLALGSAIFRVGEVAMGFILDQIDNILASIQTLAAVASPLGAAIAKAFDLDVLQKARNELAEFRREASDVGRFMKDAVAASGRSALERNNAASIRAGQATEDALGAAQRFGEIRVNVQADPEMREKIRAGIQGVVQRIVAEQAEQDTQRQAESEAQGTVQRGFAVEGSVG